MGEGERLSTQARVGGQSSGTQFLDVDLSLAVPELAQVEVDAASARRLRPARPAEEHITGGLDQALALDDSLACVREQAVAEMSLQNGACRLLQLQE
jgi:hypothetical protein